MMKLFHWHYHAFIITGHLSGFHYHIFCWILFVFICWFRYFHERNLYHTPFHVIYCIRLNVYHWIHIRLLPHEYEYCRHAFTPPTFSTFSLTILHAFRWLLLWGCRHTPSLIALQILLVVIQQERILAGHRYFFIAFARLGFFFWEPHIVLEE